MRSAKFVAVLLLLVGTGCIRRPIKAQTITIRSCEVGGYVALTIYEDGRMRADYTNCWPQ